MTSLFSLPPPHCLNFPPATPLDLSPLAPAARPLPGQQVVCPDGRLEQQRKPTMSSTLSPSNSTPFINGHQRSRSLKHTLAAPFLSRRSKSGASLPHRTGPEQRPSALPPLPQKETVIFADEVPILHIFSKRKDVQVPLEPSPSSISRASRFPDTPPTTPKSGNSDNASVRSSSRTGRTPSPSRRVPTSQTATPSPSRHRRTSPRRLSVLFASPPRLSYIDLYSDSDDSDTLSADEDEELDDFLAHPSRVASALLLFPLPPPRSSAAPRPEIAEIPRSSPRSTMKGLGLGSAFGLLESKSKGIRLEEAGWEREEQDSSSLMTPPLSPTFPSPHHTDSPLSSSSSGSSSSPSTPSTSPFINLNTPELVEVPEEEVEDDFTRRLRALEHRKRQRRDSWAGSKLTTEQRLARRRSVDALFWRCSLAE